MLDWLKNFGKDYPDFWKEYISKFETKSTRFVAISTETSGLDADKDVIFSIACIGIVENQVVISDHFEVDLLQKENTVTNTSNEFLNSQALLKLTEPEAVQSFVEYIGNAVLVGHRIYYEVEMINEALDKMKCGKLKNEALDIEVMYQRLHDINDKKITLEDLIETYKIPKNDRNTTSDDAYAISLLFLRLKAKLENN
jgi:DNA polymerase III subunit epsilon